MSTPTSGVFHRQPAEHFKSADPWEIKIEDPEIRTKVAELGDRLPADRHLDDFRLSLGGKQPSQPRSGDRVIVDDRQFEGPRAASACAAAPVDEGSQALTESPPCGRLVNMRRPPIAVTRSRMPTRP